ncbi:MAG TPA: nucleoside deaminase [Methylovirgula sp.]
MDQHKVIDIKMMARCIELSKSARSLGEFPFAALICKGDEVIVEAVNRVARERDVTRHAEIVAISEAQKRLGRKNLNGCTIYSTVEPCPMCSFPIRETKIRKVVYAIKSPMMGGHSKFSILNDREISRAMPEVFGDVPEVIDGLLHKEAEKVWWRWNPIVWSVIRHRGCFGHPKPQKEAQGEAIPLPAPFPASLRP